MAEENKKKHHRGRRKKKGGSNIVSNIILVIAIVVFAVSAYKLYGIFSEYNKGDKEYQKIQDLVINTEKKDDTKEEAFSVDFEKLLEMNSDVVDGFGLTNRQRSIIRSFREEITKNT